MSHGQGRIQKSDIRQKLQFYWHAILLEECGLVLVVRIVTCRKSLSAEKPAVWEERGFKLPRLVDQGFKNEWMDFHKTETTSFQYLLSPPLS